MLLVPNLTLEFAHQVSMLEHLRFGLVLKIFFWYFEGLYRRHFFIYRCGIIRCFKIFRKRLCLIFREDYVFLIFPQRSNQARKTS